VRLVEAYNPIMEFAMAFRKLLDDLVNVRSPVTIRLIL
jgi:hypothetical protein